MPQRREYGSGSISRRKDGLWTARVYLGTKPDGKPNIKCLYGKTEREAKAKLRKYKEDLAANKPEVIRKDTVENFMTNWLNTVKKNELKPKSFDRLEQTIKNQIVPSIGSLQLAALQSQDVQDLINSLKERGYAHSSIKKVYDAINDCFRNGIERHSVSFNPTNGVSIPSKNQFAESEIVFYSREEVRRIYESALGVYGNGNRMYRLGAAVVLDINTGLRFAELAGLKWSDIDFDRRTLAVSETRVRVKAREKDSDTNYITIKQTTAKTKAGLREMVLNNDAIAALHDLYAVTGEYEYVLSTKDGNPVGQKAMDTMLRKILLRADVSKDRVYGFHALRHTFATLLLANGTDIKTVSELLGHSDTAITYKTYIHVIKEAKRSAVNQVADFLSA